MARWVLPTEFYAYISARKSVYTQIITYVNLLADAKQTSLKYGSALIDPIPGEWGPKDYDKKAQTNTLIHALEKWLFLCDVSTM